MSFITFQCYSCSKSLKVPVDKAGRKAKCNQCGTVLTIPAQSNIAEEPQPRSAVHQSGPPPMPHAATFPTAVDPSTQVQGYSQPVEQAYDPTDVGYVQQPGGYPPPAPGGYPPPGMQGGFPPPMPGYQSYPPGESDEYGEDDYAGSGPRPSWKFVKLAMLLCFIASCVMAGAYALHVIGYLLLSIPAVQLLTGSMSFSGGPGDTPRVLLTISTLISLMASIAAIVGYVFCILGPNKKNSFGLAIAVVAVASLEVLLIMIVQLPALFDNRGFFGTGQSGVGRLFLFLFIQLLYGAEIILFCLVVRAFSFGLKKKQHAKGSLVPLFIVAGYTGARFLNFIFMMISSNVTNQGAAQAMGWINLILLWLGIGAFIAFIAVYTTYLWKTWKIIPEK